jgi:hypothetical protein
MIEETVQERHDSARSVIFDAEVIDNEELNALELVAKVAPSWPAVKQ